MRLLRSRGLRRKLPAPASICRNCHKARIPDRRRKTFPRKTPLRLSVERRASGLTVGRSRCDANRPRGGECEENRPDRPARAAGARRGKAPREGRAGSRPDRGPQAHRHRLQRRDGRGRAHEAGGQLRPQSQPHAVPLAGPSPRQLQSRAAEVRRQPVGRGKMAQIERMVEVEEVEGAQGTRPTLASRVSDAAAAQLLIFDELPDDERPRPGGRVLLVGSVSGGATLIARYVRAERQKETPALKRIDLPFAIVVVFALLALLAFLRAMSSMPRVDLDRDALVQNPERFAKYQVKPAEKASEPPKAKELSGAKEGDKSAGAEGKLGKREPKKKEAAPSKPGGDPDKKRKDLSKIKKLGLIAALSKMGAVGGGGAGLPGPRGLGAGVNPSLGGTRARAGVGDAYGVGGLGTRGTGAGGGGQ